MYRIGYDDDDDSVVHGPVQVTETLMLNAEKMIDVYKFVDWSSLIRRF